MAQSVNHLFIHTHQEYHQSIRYRVCAPPSFLHRHQHHIVVVGRRRRRCRPTYVVAPFLICIFTSAQHNHNTIKVVRYLEQTGDWVVSAHKISSRSSVSMNPSSSDLPTNTLMRKALDDSSSSSSEVTSPARSNPSILSSMIQKRAFPESKQLSLEPDRKKLRTVHEIVRAVQHEIVPPLQEITRAPAELPDPSETVSPDEFFLKLVKAQCNLEFKVKPAQELTNFFSPGTEEQIAAYTSDVVSAARTNNVEALKELTAQGKTLNCLNRFGESLVHMACRRGFYEMVDFLLEQPGVSVRIVDDCGRTVLHDCCWNPSPQLEICKRVMELEPALFLVSDRRGFTPFQYARPEHWKAWRHFLFENRETLSRLSEPETLEHFS